MVELLRRYSARSDLLGPLTRVWDMINSTSSDSGTITTTNGRTASLHYRRTILTDDQLAEITEAYKSGTTAKVLAKRYNVHITTIKKKLRKYGARRDRSVD